MEDPHAAHQIVITNPHSSSGLAVSCTCLRVGRHGCVPLEVKVHWAAGEMQRVWMGHMITMREKV